MDLSRHRAPVSGLSPSPAAARLNAGTSRSIAAWYALFAAFSSLLSPSITPTDASVGRLSAPPATSPAPLLTTPFSQIRFCTTLYGSTYHLSSLCISVRDTRRSSTADRKRQRL